MAKGICKVFLLGNLGRDPEVRYTQSGTAVCNFSLATERSVKKGDEWVPEVEWHKLVAWGKLAEVCGEYLSKGSKVHVEGRLQTRSWEDQNGNKRWTTEIVVQELTFLGGRQDENTERTEEQQSSSRSDDSGYDPESEADVPF